MSNSSILELVGFDDEACPFVETGGLKLGCQTGFGGTSEVGAGERQLEHPRGDPPPPPGRFDRHAADFGTRSIQKQPQSGDHLLAARGEGNYMQRFMVTTVELLLAGHPLLAAKDLLTNANRPA